jgi:hypothetical protein
MHSSIDIQTKGIQTYRSVGIYRPTYTYLDGVVKLHEATSAAGEHLGHVERLRHESLCLARARDSELVVL